MLTAQLDINTAEIYTCAFATDGVRALIGSEGNPVGLWDLTTGRLLREYDHAGPVWALAWSGDQRSFLSLDGTMRLWEADTGKLLREFDGHHARCVAWSGDHERVLSASNGVLRMCDFHSGLLCRCRRERTTLDLATFASVAALILLVALVASYFPARRAARVDPVRALAAE